ncbi:wd40 repeat-containing protein : RNA polymerase sigma factor, sigma-70 family OS=Singulisphaera acidiphila (strain ATCC BAA-1392 / DSM 18658 / VKM B-2454 / MOB10) GN=Sinac_7487 PE=4 SV=1: Sigma70_r2: Sigma70_r4_2: WD40: WD40: WD40: WD40 [Gemmataceae bacterium]|nr:wd40 repeat-containing protein : RNA polymerase sigma factor, sigma-70 family OS=Singulisphaera acidiphila (strain ATCC BAA-1392 / DSM 18658 / VKM B-2454 / MOB10) GN=Sinac_7487 PE=4 SV=1: Sigma70_r2: Sigma70_r4_2: WD40: WD40: WD40: WD40 [Gemmataceae bacterium]VTT96647.1 wd40 repeat-containing protein : RNA polymerase sigma factor, sigma-70 family OS=Singulisphaera acidiphila (strain ATCC BAA-1392 / DSM 18658 / VKM B-2454 / MOB10) GN=Sinac_7487 PE=4 SV=1: Sigma70_r2: Sigma70_r4_2: WD40: WD40: WD
MLSNPMTAFLRRLRASPDDLDAAADGDLLARFVQHRDEAALAELVRRHAPMVWGVCRRVLRDYHDTEDAFQATFVVLARKAAAVRDRALVANWLYGVAHQTAVRARAMAAKNARRVRPDEGLPEAAAAEATGTALDAVLPLLDEELSRLPDRFRSLIVLCDLEGKTRAEAAALLGCPEGTVASRLARGRALLATRLTRRGVAGTAATLATMPPAAATAASPPAVAAAAAVSPTVNTLAEAVVKTMLLNKLGVVLAAVLVGGTVLGGGVGLGVAACGAGDPGRASSPGRDGGAGDAAATNPARFDTIEAERTVAVQADKIIRLAVSRDGKMVATAGTDNVILLWDPTDWRKAPQRLEGHDHMVTGLAFSPDGGGALASSSFDRRVRIWDTRKGKEFVTLEEPRKLKEAVTSLSLSADGKLLAGGGKGLIWVWDLTTGQAAAELSAKGPVWATAFDPTNKSLAVGTSEALTLWDIKKEAVRLELVGHESPVRCVAFVGPDTVVSADDDGAVIFWDAASGKRLASHGVHRVAVCALAVSPDQRTLVTGDASGAVRVWDVRTRTSVAHRLDPVALRAGSGQAIRGAVSGLGFLGDGTTVVCAVEDQLRVIEFERKHARK